VLSFTFHEVKAVASEVMSRRLSGSHDCPVRNRVLSEFVLIYVRVMSLFVEAAQIVARGRIAVA
jgi:hypothetical protein